MFTLVKILLYNKEKITNACAMITPTQLENVSNNFVKRLKSCVHENGGIFENKLTLSHSILIQTWEKSNHYKL